MKSSRDIKRGGLREKMSGFAPEPPESVWQGISGRLGSGGRRRTLVVVLAAAAGLALAVTVGISLLSPQQDMELASEENTILQDKEMQQGLEQETPAEGLKSPAGQATGEAGMEVPSTQEKPSNPVVKDQGGPSRSKKLEKKVKDLLQEVIGNEQGNPAPVNLAVNTTSESDTGYTDLLHDKKAGSEEAILEKEDEIAAGETGVEDASNETIGGAAIESATDSLPADFSLVEPITKIEDETERLTEKKSHGRWSLGAIISPAVSYRDAASESTMQNEAVNNAESPRLAYSGGFQVSYRQSDRLAFESGIYYSKMGVNIGDFSSFRNNWGGSDIANESLGAPTVVGISNSMGTVITKENAVFMNSYSSRDALADYHTLTPDEMTVANNTVEAFTQTFNYFEIPFNVKYKVIDRKVDLQLIGGVSTNFLLGTSVAAMTMDGPVEIGEVGDVREINYAANAGLGIVYSIFDRLSLNVEPRFRYFLNSINTDLLPVTRPYAFVLNTGIYYTF